MSGCTHCFAYDDTIIDEQQRVRTSHRCFFVLIMLLHFFFFSSRRRHTRYWRDWSSDVCSSDLWRYRRRVTLPAGRSGLRYFLRGAGGLSEVTPTVNGHALDQRLGGYLPFEYEITPYLTAGVNQLELLVDGGFGLDVPPDRPGQPSVSVDYWQPAGLYREVSLAAVPATFLADVFAKPVDVLSPAGRRIELQATVDSVTAATVTVDFALWDGVRRLAGVSVTASAAVGTTVLTGALRGLAGTELWDLDRPRLYRVVATLRVDGVAIHDYQVRIGLRQAEFTDNGFLLNGRRIQLFGLNRHQFYPFLGGAAPARVQRK